MNKRLSQAAGDMLLWITELPYLGSAICLIIGIVAAICNWDVMGEGPG